MRERGLSRTAGSSWIEVRSEVRVFFTADKRHRNKDEIYEVLRLLVHDVMKNQDTNVLTIF